MRPEYTPKFSAKFWRRVDRSSGPDACWPWCGKTNSHGYGEVQINKRRRVASRVALELSGIELPQELKSLHSCDNPPCCNPAHLFAGTDGDNMRDMVRKGRQKIVAPDHVGEKNPRARLSEGQVIEIRARAAQNEQAKSLAASYGISADHAQDIISGRRWKHLLDH